MDFTAVTGTELRLPKPRLGPAAGRREASRRPCAQSGRGVKGALNAPGPNDLPDVRVLGPDQQLCYWWNKGYRYDGLSWYGLEHATS